MCWLFFSVQTYLNNLHCKICVTSQKNIFTKTDKACHVEINSYNVIRWKHQPSHRKHEVIIVPNVLSFLIFEMVAYVG